MHCGSRALGQACYQHYLKLCQTDDEQDYSFEGLFMRYVLEISPENVQSLASIDNCSLASALQSLQNSPARIRTCHLKRFKADLIRFMKGGE